VGVPALLSRHVDFELRAPGGDGRPPAVAGAREAADAHLGEAEQSRLLTHRPLGRLSRERMAGAAAIPRQVDAPSKRGLDHRERVARVDAAVIDAVRQRHEVAGEAIAADVGRLPDPLLVDELAHRVVERTPIDGAAAVVLAMRADQEERVLDGRARIGERQLEQVVVPLELDAT
jgi:hypothetical protein